MTKPVRTTKIPLMLVSTALLTLGLAGCLDDDDDEEVSSRTATTTLKAGKICTGATTGTYYQYAGGIIEATKETLGVNLENTSTVGSLENANGIASGRCDMAIVQEDIYLYSGERFQTNELIRFRSMMGGVAALYKEQVHILVNRDSGITSVADLAGKKVNVGEQDSGTFYTAYKILTRVHQVSPEPEYVYEAPATAVAKVVDGTYDATFYVAAAPISTLANLPADANVTLISATNPGFVDLEYLMGEIPATTYPWLYSDISNNIEVRSMLTIGASIDQAKLSQFLETLYLQKESYATQYHAKWSELDKSANLAAIKATPLAWNREAVSYVAEVSLPTVEAQPYFCSASPSGTYTKVVKDLIPVVESTLGLSLAETHTAGSLENINKLYNGECAIAIAQQDVFGYLYSQFQNSTTIPEEMLKFYSLERIMLLYQEDVHLVVNTGSGISSSRNLLGKKVNLGEQLSGTFVSTQPILTVNGLEMTDITPFYDSPEVALPKVISGEYDAMFVVSKAPVSYLVEADCPTDVEVPGCIAGNPTTLPIKLVPITSFASGSTLSAQHYPWQTEDIPNSPQIWAVIFVMTSFDNNSIADLIQAVYDIKVGDTTLSPTWDETTLEQGVASFKRLPLYFNPLAAQYFLDNME
jgi:TRAP transporter TAXI family solute receptor